MVEGWRYYNHAALPTCAPHESPDLTPIKDGSIWKIGGGMALLARWTEEFDCDKETDFWYCILDKPFDLSAIKSSKRYKINKGTRYFEVKEIEPMDYADELFKVQVAAFSAYPSKYRPVIDKETFFDSCKLWMDEIQIGKIIFYGCFFRETGEICGYHVVDVNEEYRGCRVLKTNPNFEKYQINAAIVYKWVSDAEKFIKAGGYLQNGTRSINHETNFQEYLEYYFGFRKAYCKLKVAYRPLIKPVIKILYPLRKLIRRLDGIGKIHSLNAVLKMEEIGRSC